MYKEVACLQLNLINPLNAQMGEGLRLWQTPLGLHPLERFTPRLSQKPLLFYAALTANNKRSVGEGLYPSRFSFIGTSGGKSYRSIDVANLIGKCIRIYYWCVTYV
jgi:hypothetical protein